MRLFALSLLAMLLAAPALADTITTTSGSTIECVILQENSQSVVVRRGYGTMTYPRSTVASIQRTPAVTRSDVPAVTPIPSQRVPAWTAALSSLLKNKWASDVQQIPSTVVDVGVMRYVPYMSYRCATDYEINIYGDPDHPAAIEIGVYRTLLSSSQAKQNSVDFIASLLANKTDAAIVKVMDKAKDLVVRDDWTTEITPADAPDAYGGWWVSVYSEKQLDAARATDDEMKQITVARDVPSSNIETRPVVSVAKVKVIAAPKIDPDSDAWTAADMAYAQPSSTHSSGGSAGSVYVRGYERANGTYVSAHTRSAPHR